MNVQDQTPVLNDFTLGPTRFLLSMLPGDTQTVDVELTNREGKPMIYDLSTEDFIADPGREGTPTFFGDGIDGPYPARLWVTPEIRRVELNHGERAFIRVTVRVPRGSDAGDHQTALIVTRETKPAPNAAGFNIVSRVASLFVITVQGNVVEKGSILNLSARHTLNWFLPVFLHMEGRDDGTVHMLPVGSVQIRNIFGILVDEIPFTDWVILRNSSRAIDFTWGPRFALGRYTATTHFTAFNGHALQDVTTSFWVVPLLPVLLILLAIFFVSFLVQYFFSRFEIRTKGSDKNDKHKQS
jgi:hypothetical protein